MTHQEAIQFIQPAVLHGKYTWADLGAGAGRFTKALAALVGPKGTIYAVDRSDTVRSIRSTGSAAEIIPLQADFTTMPSLPQLDGLLIANALHYVLKKESFLINILSKLPSGGTFVLIEYDRSIPNPWVPFPIREKQFAKLADKVGLSTPTAIYRRPSNYGQGDLYSVYAQKL